MGNQPMRGFCLLSLGFLALAGHAAEPVPVAPAESTRAESTPVVASTIAAESTPAKALFRGQVVLLSEALKQQKIAAYDQELAGLVALRQADGSLLPILPDWRGRAFYQDERLRHRPVELVGFRRQGIPFLQVLMVFTFDGKQQRQYTDYWCDICSIPMYEIKPCDCCQQDIRLRFQPQALPADVSAAVP